MITTASRQLLDKAIDAKHKQLERALQEAIGVSGQSVNLPPIRDIVRDLQALYSLTPKDEAGNEPVKGNIKAKG